MTKKDHLDPERPPKRTVPNKYRPITCLPIMWKIITAQIREEIYYSLISCRLFPEEQKGCRKRTRGTGESLNIDQQILNERKTRRKNVAIAWIDRKRAYDIVTQSWIIHCLKMNKISDEVKVYRKTMETWWAEMTTGGKSLAMVKIPRGIFQGDALSPLLFVIAMVPLNRIVRKCRGYANLENCKKRSTT